MFGLFKKKKPVSALDQLIYTIYGNPPPQKRANVKESISLAADDLLMKLVDGAVVEKQALELDAGPVPYSTQDLAIAVALHFFKQEQLAPRLRNAQLMARFRVMQWLQDGLAAPVLVKIFEDTLYKMYKPTG